MLLNDLYKKAKETGGEVIERPDGNFRLYYKTIYDISKWTTPLEMLEIKDSIDDNTQEVIVHGIVRKRKDIPKCISRHVSFNSTKAFKRWIQEMYRVMMRTGHKIKILEAQAHLPKDTKYKESSGVTYVSGLKCYVCNTDCLQCWTTWKKGRKATCTRECMDRGMYHDMQDKHNGKWWDDYSNYKGYKQKKRKDPETGEIISILRHHESFFKAYGRMPKKGYQLHHINMNKLDNYISNLDELTAKKHQDMHATLNPLVKPLMEMGILGYKKGKGYYLIKQ